MSIRLFSSYVVFQIAIISKVIVLGECPGWSLLRCDETSKLFVLLCRGKYHCLLKACEQLKNRCLEIKSTETKTHLWQLSPIVVFSSAKSLVLEDVKLPRCEIILKYFLNEIVHFCNIFNILFEPPDAKIVFGLRNVVRTFGYPDSG